MLASLVRAPLGITVLFAASSLLLLALVVEAQEAKKVARVGYLAAVSAAADAPRAEAFRQGLRELGYIEGQNLSIAFRYESTMFDRLPELAAELVRLKIDVLVTVTTNAAIAGKNAAGAVPIVFMGVTDPVGAGLVDSLPRPGGTRTGITNMAAALTAKRLQLLKEVLPRLSRLAVLWDPNGPGSIPQWKESQLAAGELGLQVLSMEVSSVDKYEDAFQDVARAGSTAMAVTLNPLANSNQKRIADLAINHRVPTICARTDFAENGCLMSYGPSYGVEGRDGARYVDKILKGVKPADLPVQQPTTFELAINMNTARALGLTIPNSLLLRADQVIR